MSRPLQLFACLLLGVLCSVPAFAQSDRASVTGRVTDTSGAVVGGAAVKITDSGTGAVFNTTTGGEGTYSSPAVFKPGNYKVEASHEGFKTEAMQIVLQISDVRQVNFTLSPGAASEIVNVTSETSQLETETSNRGEVITGRQITELPLRGRNFTNLATLMPGVSRTFVGTIGDQQQFNQGDPNAGSVPGMGDSRGDTPAARFSRSGGGNISANGLRPTNNNFSLDGVDNNEPQYNTVGLFPNPDAIQEFKVETSVGKAETGRGGANINTIFQSGSNDIHGSGFLYGQNEALNATHPEIKRQNGLLAAGATPLPKSAIDVREFGFTLGGPIIKDRTFIFGDYLGQRNSIPNFFKDAVPTAKSRMGDFSEFSTLVFDPVTGKAFPGNIIPNLQSRPDFSAPAFKFLALFPLPNIANVKDPNNGGNPNFAGTRANSETIDAFDIKLDHRVFTNNTLSGRYSQNNQERVRANFFPKLPTAGFGAGNEIGNTRQIVVTDTQVFRPTLLNEFRFGYTKVDLGILNCGVKGACGVSPTFCSDIGIPNCNKGTPGTTGGLLTGGFGTGEFEFTGDGGLFEANSSNFYVADSVTLVSGKHTWKAGIEVRPRRLDTICGGCSGFQKGHLQYAVQGDCKPGAPNPSSSTCNVQSDYLLGRPAVAAFSASLAGNGSPFQLRSTEYAVFLQDDWKVAPNLTVNAGVRYEVFPAFSESKGRLANYNVASKTIRVATGSGQSLVDTAYTNVAPRIGAAYTFGPSHQFVLRGGFGVFYTQDSLDYYPLIKNPPLTSSVNINGPAFGGNQSFNLTTGPPVAPLANPPVITQDTSLFSLPINQKTGKIYEGNLTLQWQLAKDYLVDFGYVASRGHNLLAARQLGNNDNGLGLAQVPGPCAGGGCFINSAVIYENRASSNYDSLQAELKKNFSYGVQGRMSYTWSHAIDDSTGVFGGAGETRGAAGGPLNPLDFRVDRSNSSLDKRHLFSGNAIWDLPFGKGKAYGGDAGPVADRLIGGWQANIIVSGQSGQPFGVQGDAPGFRTTANLNGDPFANRLPGFMFNPRAFSNPQPGNPGTVCVNNLAGKKICYGNSGRNRFTGPGFIRSDASIFKNTTITERVKLQIGFELFNLLNSNNHVVPDNYINDGNFGQFNNSLPPRTAQYRVKLLF